MVEAVMNLTLGSIGFAAGLFVGMVLLLELGRKIGRRHQGKDEESARAGLGAVEGAVFALMGLLIAFTFSGAANRFDSRRQLIVEEANAIGTAWLRLDLLPSSAQPELRDLFRRYLDARLAVFGRLPDVEVARSELVKAGTLQREIWTRGVAASQQSRDPLAAQVIVALNQMFDMAESRTLSARMHPPSIVFIMLGVLALMSSLLAGFAMAGGKSRSWIHMVGFSLIMATTVYVILDLEFPRIGLIRIDATDRVLYELRDSMK
jgi:hypothetical protein